MAAYAARESQFALPRGALGSVVGWVMAVGNADMEHRAITALNLRGHEVVLEIGFGPGIGILRCLLIKLRRRFRHSVSCGQIR